MLTASMHRWKRGDAPSWRAARSASALGEALYLQGHVTEAKRYLAASSSELSIDPKAEIEAAEKAQTRFDRYLQASDLMQKDDQSFQLASKQNHE